MTTDRAKGDIFTSIPAVAGYQAGSRLACSVSAVNLTTTPGEYMVLIKTYDRVGRQVEEQVFTVDGMAWFELDGEDRMDTDGTVMFQVTDVTVVFSLIERSTQEEVASTSVVLRR